MIKNELQIEQDFWNVIKDNVAELIGGSVYKSGMRPVDSDAEDIVITVSNADSQQVQSGDVYVLMYCKDLFVGNTNVPNKVRLSQLAELDEVIVDALQSEFYYEYDFELARASAVNQIPNIKQHCISTKIEFKRKTF